MSIALLSRFIAWRKQAAIAAALLLAGCAIEPDAVRFEAAHQSSIGQHEPFTDHPTDYGMNTLGVVAKWQRGPIVAEISEGYSVHGMDGCAYCPSRDVFRASVGYEIPLK